MMKTKAQRLEIVRNAVAEATRGLEGAAYREFMEDLLSDAEGWKMEVEEMDDDS